MEGTVGEGCGEEAKALEGLWEWWPDELGLKAGEKEIKVRKGIDGS